MRSLSPLNAERMRLENQRLGKENWRLWGPYLSERAWGTVREDYSADGRRLGVIFRTIRPDRAPIAGARMGSAAFAMRSKGFVLLWPFGTARTRS